MRPRLTLVGQGSRVPRNEPVYATCATCGDPTIVAPTLGNRAAVFDEQATAGGCWAWDPQQRVARRLPQGQLAAGWQAHRCEGINVETAPPGWAVGEGWRGVAGG